MPHRIRLVALAASCIALILVAAPAAASAACSDPLPIDAQVQPAGPVATGRAAGDDPALTPGPDGLCDDAGYDLAFPDVQLATDVAPASATPAPTGTLPVTGTPATLPALALLGLLLLLAGTASWAVATPVQDIAR